MTAFAQRFVPYRERGSVVFSPGLDAPAETPDDDNGWAVNVASSRESEVSESAYIVDDS